MTANAPYSQNNPNLRGMESQQLDFPLRGALDGYGASRGIQDGPDQHRPYTALTLDEGLRVEVDEILELVLTYIEATNTWHGRALQAKLVNSLSAEWESLTTHFAILDHTAEGVTPRLVQLEVEKHSERLLHYQQGLEMRGEFFKTPKGQRAFKIKLNSIRENSRGTANIIIANGLTEVHDYWREQERRYGRQYGNIADRIREEIRLWGILSIDEKGIYKLVAEIDDMVKGHSRAPNFNMAVAPQGFKSWLAFGHNYETEASRRGDAGTQSALTRGGDAIVGVIPVPLYEDVVKHPQNMQVEDVDFFRRESTTGVFAVLQYNDYGEPNVNGVREPEIKLISMPEDDWVKFSASWALKQCLRFAHDGSLSDSIFSLVDNLEAQARAFGGLKTEFPDPFLWKVHKRSVAGMSQVHKGADFARVEYGGDQDTHWRSTDWDMEFAVRSAAKSGLTQTESQLIYDLLDAIKSCYDITASSISDADAGRLRGLLATLATTDVGADGMVKQDPEWHSADLTSIVAAMNADLTRPSKPYFLGGDIPSMMTFLKHGFGRLMVDTWGYGRIDYEATKMALRKLWSSVNYLFPDLSLASVAFTPFQNRGPDDETNKMLAVFSSLLDHVKYPIFWSNGAQRADLNSDAFAGLIGVTPAQTEAIFAETIPAVLRGLVGNAQDWDILDKGFELLRPAEDDGGLVGPNTTAAEFFRQQITGPGSVESKRNLLAAVMGMAAMYYDQEPGDFRAGQIPKLTDVAIEGLKRAEARIGSVGGGFVTTSISNLRLTVSGKFFHGTIPTELNNLLPADPKNPSISLVEDRVGNNIFPSARSGLDDTIFAHAGLMRPTTTNEQGHEDASSEQQPQHIGPSGYVVNGPFQLISELETTEGRMEVEVKDRRFMLERFTALKSCNLGPIERLFGFSMLLSRVHRRSFATWLRAGIPIWMNFGFIQPFFRVRTDAFMMCEGGAALGYFGYNFQDTAFQYDGGHKQWLLNYTMWAGAFVIDPTKVFWKEDAKFAGYMSGLSSTVFREPSMYDAAGDRKFDYASRPNMFVVDLPVSHDRQRMLRSSNPMHLFGKPDGHYYDFRFMDRNSTMNTTEPSFPSWFFYNNIFNFGKINDRQRYNAESYAMLRRCRFVPGTCMHRALQTYNGNEWEMGFEGSSHLDRIGHPPILPTLNGKLTLGEQKPFSKSTA